MNKPSIEFDYPTPAHGRIPSFNSAEEEAEFWDTHDFTDFLDESRPVELVVDPAFGRRLSVRLEPEKQDELERRAAAQGTEPEHLARRWLEERLRQEQEADALAATG